MKVLVIGKGGREHALADSCLKSPIVSEVFVAPGNGGMIDDFIVVDICDSDNDSLVSFAIDYHIDLTIVGPESCLSNGIVDDFEKKGLKIFGPSKAATMIESSKEFSKDLMKKYGIPTAKYETFSDYDLALEYIKSNTYPVVIKYDGLAAGKGVVIVNNDNEAQKTLKDMLLDNVYGNSKVVIEEFLEGIEFSLMCMVNASNVFAMEVSQDHKQLCDGDNGPNTGGMGAFSPVDVITKEIVDDSMEIIMKPIAKALVEEQIPFVGFLYGGLMLTKDGVKVIEFNARFGDPEAEVVLPRLESDFVENILDVLDGKTPKLVWSPNYVVGVVMASNGYPSSYDTGYLIEGDLQDVYHMGTVFNNGLYTNGGRVLLAKGSAKTLDKAITNAYNVVSKIKCDNFVFRTDIGKRDNKI